MRITYDWWTKLGPPPEPGDILEARRRRDRRPTGTRYLIVHARQVRQRKPRVDWVRYALEVGRVESVPSDVRVEPVFWHPRRRR